MARGGAIKGKQRGDDIAICRYQVKRGKERQMEALLGRHHGVLVGAGLARTTPHLILRGKGSDGRTFYVEILAWKSPSAADRAHQSAAVMDVWEPMGALCDLMEFPHGELISPRRPTPSRAARPSVKATRAVKAKRAVKARPARRAPRRARPS